MLGGRLTEFFGVLYKVKNVKNVVGIFECKINDLWACIYVGEEDVPVTFCVVKYISMTISNLSGGCRVNGVFCSGPNGLGSFSTWWSQIYDMRSGVVVVSASCACNCVGFSVYAW